MHKYNFNSEFIANFDKYAPYVEDKIDRGIEEHRKSLFRFTLTDEKGEPLVGVPVHINLVNHEFLFGAPLFLLNQLDSDAQGYTRKNCCAYATRRLFRFTGMPLSRRRESPVTRRILPSFGAALP